jgi:hypothetical protein
MNLTRMNVFTRGLVAAGFGVLLAASAVHAQSQDQTLNSASDPAAVEAAQTGSPIPPAQNTQIKPAYWATNAGFSGDSSSTGYGYAGPSYLHPFRRNLAWETGANVNYLYYGFNNGLGGRTNVHSPGINTEVGLRAGDTNWVQFGLGPGIKNRNVRVENASGTMVSDTHDMTWGMNYNAMAYVNPSKRNNVMGLYHYGAEDKYTWSMAQFKQQVANDNWQGPITPSIGIQGIAEGNKDVHATSVGALIELVHVKSSMSITGTVGMKHSWSVFGPAQNGPYFGIGIWRRM